MRRRRRRVQAVDARKPHMLLEAVSDMNSLLTSRACAKPPTTAEGGSGRRRGTERWDLTRGGEECGDEVGDVWALSSSSSSSSSPPPPPPLATYKSSSASEYVAANCALGNPLPTA
jgi:hypothetical protein